MPKLAGPFTPAENRRSTQFWVGHIPSDGSKRFDSLSCVTDGGSLTSMYLD